MGIFIEKVEEERKFDVVDENGKTIKLKILTPNSEQLRDADLKYKIKFGQAIKSGLLTKAQAKRFIRENNLLDEETEKRYLELTLKIKIIRDSLFEEEDKGKGLDTIKELADLKIELAEINELTSDIMNNTAEAYADDFRNQWMCSELTMKNDGSRYYKDFEDFASNMNNGLNAQIIIASIEFFSGLKHDFEMQYEENKWMVDKKIMNNDGTVDVDEFLAITSDDGEKEEKAIVPVKKPKVNKKPKGKKARVKK